MTITTLGLLGDLSLIAELAPDEQTAIRRVKHKLTESIPKVERDTVKAVIEPLLRSKDILRELEHRNDTWKCLADATESFIDQGMMGLMIYGNSIYPLNLDIQEDFLWTPEREVEIMTALVERFMITENILSFEGDVQLFEVRGFSGDVKHFTMARRPPGASDALASLFRPSTRQLTGKRKR